MFRLTFTNAVRTEHGGMVDALGYAWCIDCRPFDRQAWMRASDLTGPCDGCGRVFEDCRPIEIDGTAAVEHVPCKVF